MTKRIILLVLAALMIFGVVDVGAISVRATTNLDSLNDVAMKVMAAVKSGQTSCRFTTNSVDMNDLLKRLFDKYPMLLHYFESAESTCDQTYMMVTLFLRNTDDALDELWVIGSDEELLAALGIGLLEARAEIQFVTKDGYIPSDETIDAAINLLHYQYPVVYMGYNGRTTAWIEYENSGVRDYTVTFQYFYNLNAQTLLQWRRETEQVVLDLTSSMVAQDMPDYLKVLLIHDWIVNNAHYNTSDLDEAGNHLAYGALVKGSCVCMGYAEAGLLMFQAAGIEAYYISGTGTNSTGQTEDHGWNAVKIDGEWYLVDITWDDPTMDDGTEVLRYDYFLLTDSQLAKDHTWERGSTPACAGTTWNAERALAAYELDAGVYTQYYSSLYITMAQAEDRFRQTLTSSVEIMDALQEEVAIITENPESPEKSELPEKPAENAQNTQELEETKRGRFFVVIIIVAVITVVVATVIVTHANTSHRRRSKYGGSRKRNSGTRSYVHFD